MQLLFLIIVHFMQIIHIMLIKSSKELEKYIICDVYMLLPKQHVPTKYIAEKTKLHWFVCVDPSRFLLFKQVLLK